VFELYFYYSLQISIKYLLRGNVRILIRLGITILANQLYLALLI
jgi:hypothetical protein